MRMVTRFLGSGRVAVFVYIFSRRSCRFDGILFSSVGSFVSGGCVTRRGDSFSCSRDFGPSEGIETSGEALRSRNVSREVVYTSRCAPPFNSSLRSFVGSVKSNFTDALFTCVSTGKVASIRYCGGTGMSGGAFSGVGYGAVGAPEGHATITFTVTLRLSVRSAQGLLTSTKLTLSRDGGFSVVVRCFVLGNGCGVFRVGRTLFRFSRRLLNSLWLIT